MSDIIDTEEIDRDTVDKEVLEQQFKKKYKLLTETAVSLSKSYINKLHGNKSLKLAVSQSDNSIEVYQLNNSSLTKVCRLSGHAKGLTEVVCDPKEEHHIYSSGLDGVLKLWDTRTSGSCVQEYKDEEEELLRPYECMDVSHNGRVLCAGSQLVEDDAYLVFWDQRLTKPLGGYWNSHTDDITQVKFHNTKMEILATGSLDGLVNIFNVMEQTEDDALLYSLNVENSTEKLSWLDEKHVACITQSNDLQVWNTDNGDQVKSFTRDKVSRSIKMPWSKLDQIEMGLTTREATAFIKKESSKSVHKVESYERSKGDDCYLVDMYSSIDDTAVLLAGSYGGDGHVLRSVTIEDKKLYPSTNFCNNKQTVQCCWYDKDRDLLVTTGESGLISVWTSGESAENGTISKKLASSMKQLQVKRHKPY